MRGVQPEQFDRRRINPQQHCYFVVELELRRAACAMPSAFDARLSSRVNASSFRVERPVGLVGKRGPIPSSGVLREIERNCAGEPVVSRPAEINAYPAEVEISNNIECHLR